MAQHDYIIDNQTSASLRADLNNALAAIVSQNSGATAPSTTYANQFWYDTANDQLKQRNETNSTWIVLGTVNQTTNKFEPNQTFASQAEAETGTNNTLPMTPLRVAQAIDAQVVVPETPANVGIGLNQTWQSVTRNTGTTYQNTTGRSIQIAMYSQNNNSQQRFEVSPNNSTWFAIPMWGSQFVWMVVIPNGYYYRNINNNSNYGAELR